MEIKKRFFVNISGNIILVILSLSALLFNERIMDSVIDLERSVSNLHMLIFESEENSDIVLSKLEELISNPIVQYFPQSRNLDPYTSELSVTEILVSIQKDIYPVLDKQKKNFLFINRFLLFMLIIYSTAFILYMYFNKHAESYNKSLSLLISKTNDQMETLRIRISSELHDNIIQTLAVAKMSLTNNHNLEQTSDSLQIAIDDMRDLISSLNTLEVHRFSFKEVLQDIIRRVNEQSNIPVTLSMSDDLKLKSISPEISLHIIRLCQEAVSNAIRHAEASYISLRISTRGDELKIRITDNGKGFDQSDSNNSNGIGIISMRERVRQCNGVLKITPHKGAGTEVFASIPLREDLV